MSQDDPAPSAFWEKRYTDAGGDRIWSGRANEALTTVAPGLKTGTALDLGCGEGADAIWLARHGWTVTGVDVSGTAIRRAQEAAREAGVADAVRFIVADLAEWSDGYRYDLVSAAFLHSPIDFPRTEVLRRAAGLVAPGGHLLIVSHGALPWSGEHEQHSWDDAPHQPEQHFLSPREELDELALDPEEWVVELAETRDRDAVGPDGTSVRLSDGIVLLRRD